MRRIISLGAGVQSSCLPLLADDGLIPPVELALFIDPGDESRLTYEWLARLSLKTSVPIVTQPSDEVL